MFWGSTLASSGLPPFYLHPHVENRLTKQDFSANLDFSSLRSPRRLVLGVSTKKRLSKHDHLDLPRLATMRVYLRCSAVLAVLRIVDSQFGHSQDDICMLHEKKKQELGGVNHKRGWESDPHEDRPFSSITPVYKTLFHPREHSQSFMLTFQAESRPLISSPVSTNIIGRPFFCTSRSYWTPLFSTPATGHQRRGKQRPFSAMDPRIANLVLSSTASAAAEPGWVFFFKLKIMQPIACASDRSPTCACLR